MMAGVSTICEDCGGKRFRAPVLEYRLSGPALSEAAAGKSRRGEVEGLDIAEVLDLSVKDALEFFGPARAHTPAAHDILVRMNDVGLGYVRLGQPLTTLSGGERQRFKIATQMADTPSRVRPGEASGIFVLDEPTNGLHLADLQQLLGLLDRLVDSGKSVIVIEHHQGVMAHADWIIDLGPGAGHEGGRVVFEGTPAELVKGKKTLTAEHLARFVRG
jgi:excinuclease UvrABC ATPase subunit